MSERTELEVVKALMKAVEPLADLNLYPEDHRPDEVVEIRVTYGDIQAAAKAFALAKRHLDERRQA